MRCKVNKIRRFRGYCLLIKCNRCWFKEEVLEGIFVSGIFVVDTPNLEHQILQPMIEKKTRLIDLTAEQLQTIIEYCIDRKALAFHPPPPEPPDIIGIKEAAILTGYTVKSIYDMVYKGTIPHLPKNGRNQLRFSRKALIMWLSE